MEFLRVNLQPNFNGTKSTTLLHVNDTVLRQEERRLVVDFLLAPVAGLASEQLSTLLVFIVVFLASYLYISSNEQWPKRPPGPPNLPLVGALPFLGLNILEGVKRCHERYGDVVTMRLGTRQVIMLNTYETIREAFVKSGNVFTGRPQDIMFIKELTHSRGIVSCQGEQWRQQSRFAHRVMRKFGMGTSRLESTVQEEILYLTKYVHEQNSKPFDPKHIINTTLANVICSIIFGQRYHYDNPEFINILELLNLDIELVGQCGILTIFPFLRHVPGDPCNFNKLRDTCEQLMDWHRGHIVEHRRTRDPDVTRDFVDAYLDEIERQKDNEESTFTDEMLTAVIADLFGAGIETGTSTMRWGLVYMLYHPEIMQKVQDEIDEVIGSDRMPTMSDKVNMPYTEAVILEIQRMGDVIPLGVPHATMEECEFRGYRIPKGITVMTANYCVHKDSRNFEDPYTFKPERFLNAEGRVQHNEKLIAFSLGKRSCLGESLARMELFLIFTSLMQHFTWEIAPDSQLPDLYGHLSMTRMPKPYKVLTKPRHAKTT